MNISIPKLETALATIDANLAIDPRSLSHYVDRGQFLEMLGRKDEAVHAYMNALEYDSTHVEALNALGLFSWR